MIHRDPSRGRTGARVPPEVLPRTTRVKITEAKATRARLPSSPTPTGALTSPAARCSRFPGSRPRSATAPFMCGICLYPAMTAVAFYSQMDSGACRPRKWPVLAPLRTPTTRVEATWQTRLAALTARRRIGDVRDWSDGLAHRVATFLPVLLLPFHFVAFIQALRRLPPVTKRNCMRQQRRILNTAPSINNKTLLTDGSD